MIDDNVEPIIVNLGSRSYPVFVGPGQIEKIGDLAVSKLKSATVCLVVTSRKIMDLYGDTVESSLERAGYYCDFELVPEGEKAKSWGLVHALLGSMLDRVMDRDSVVFALGGGAVGDLAGFVASIYMRGLRLVQIPTTLLSQVDSSIGGKTGVNHPKGKNLIGSFHQPNLVVTDPGVLASLPTEEFRSGLAELLKYGVIADSSLLSLLEREGSAITEFDQDSLTVAIRRCVRIKARLVEEDERDVKGVRAYLNYGHTLGHALETLTGNRMRHGEAVAVGMVAASKLSVSMGLMSEDELTRQVDVLTELGLETRVKGVNPDAMIEVMKRDKKSRAGNIRFVLPRGIGVEPVLRWVPDNTIEEVLSEMSEDA